MDSLYFSPEVVPHALDTLRQGITLITDTTMAMAGINKRALNELHCQVECLIADEEVAKAAKLNGTTRSREAMIKASKLPGKLGFVIGNAPTALVALNEMMSANTLNPAFIIGVPVGFVNVVHHLRNSFAKAGALHLVYGAKRRQQCSGRYCQCLAVHDCGQEIE